MWNSQLLTWSYFTPVQHTIIKKVDLKILLLRAYSSCFLEAAWEYYVTLYHYYVMSDPKSHCEYILCDNFLGCSPGSILYFSLHKHLLKPTTALTLPVRKIGICTRTRKIPQSLHALILNVLSMRPAFFDLPSYIHAFAVLKG